jgi:hypothetical protein
MSPTQLFCPSGPYRVLVHGWSKDELLDEQRQFQSLPIDIQLYTQDGFLTPSLAHALAWRGWLARLINADESAALQDTFPVRILPELYRPQQLMGLRRFRADVSSQMTTIRAVAELPALVVTLVDQVEEMIQVWSEEIEQLAARIPDWQVKLRAERPLPPHTSQRREKRAHVDALAAYDIALHNLTTLEEQVIIDRLSIPQWRSTAQSLLASPAIPPAE